MYGVRSAKCTVAGGRGPRAHTWSSASPSSMPDLTSCATLSGSANDAARALPTCCDSECLIATHAKHSRDLHARCRTLAGASRPWLGAVCAHILDIWQSTCRCGVQHNDKSCGQASSIEHMNDAQCISRIWSYWKPSDAGAASSKAHLFSGHGPTPPSMATHRPS